MVIKPRLFFMTFLIVFGATAQQSTPYLLLQFPKSAKPATDRDTIAWTGCARPGSFYIPDSGFVYFDRTPGGSIISNYKYKIEKFCVDTEGSGTIQVQNNVLPPTNPVPPQRRIIFRPSDQTNMGYGLFYYIVGFKTKIGGRDTAFVSNELELIVESPVPVALKAPKDTITELTPVFQWEPNPSVPYYHVILSDEALNIDTVHGSMNISGLSVSWQAITPFTQITYGTPDPSGTLTSTPPPLSPGKTYFWVVLNNYKNNILYTSSKVGLPVSFTIKGKPMVKPKNFSPNNVVLNSGKDTVVTFKWTNLDPRANTYKVFLYIASDLSQVNAKMIAWSSEVTAGTFAGANGVIDTTDTGFITINARSILSRNNYTWKVFAIDDKGASTASDTCSFEYSDPATGRLVLHTVEKIISSVTTQTGTLKNSTLSIVPAVQMKVEVVQGSLEAPLLFYTDLAGYLDRDRPAGTYRITAEKSGFEPLAKTVKLDAGAIINDTFYLKRPDATVFGKVVDKTNLGVNGAAVYAVSDRGDTAIAMTDALGSFIINCYEGSWRLFAQKIGYAASLPKQAQVTYGQSYSFGTIVLEQNSFTLSTTSTNENNEPILGANIKVYQGGIKIDEIPSTPQNGIASFSLNAGTYTIIAEKIGFEQFSKTIELSGSMQLPIVMPSGAAMIKGAIIGATWIGNEKVYAPITRASVVFIDTTSVPEKTFSTVSDATYGDYGISVSGGRRFKVTASASGFTSLAALLPDLTKPENTLIFNDTLQSLGMVTGSATRSGSGVAVSDATVTLLSPAGNQVISTAKSQGNGYFELRNLPDGVFYVKAGAPGFSVDSVRASDTLYISNGKATIGGAANAGKLTVYMSPGSKTISWVVNGSADTSAVISVLSPLQKIIRHGDSLDQVGYGDYIVSAVGAADSIIDCVYHPFTVLASESKHIDSVELPAFNATGDSLSITNDSIRLLLSSNAALDSAAVFYRDITVPTYSILSRKASAMAYSFSIRPPKDGSTMNYYFRAYRGNDIFGSSSKTYFSYIRPDTSRLSKVELIPSPGDTVSLGARCEIRIALQGYFGSTFIPAKIRDSTAIQWKLLNIPPGTRFIDSTGTEIAFVTGDDSASQLAVLKAFIDTTKQKVTPQVAALGEKTMYFKITGKTIKSVRVRRIDAGNPNPVIATALSMAQFVAEGVDEGDRALMISPTWSISPSLSGSISSVGLFTPSLRFSGNVRIYGQANGMTGEYNALGKTAKEYGMEINHCILAKSLSDTVSNLQGCTLIFPPDVVTNDKMGLLQISMPSLENKLELSSGAMSVVGNVYDILEEKGVTFQFSNNDSIRLILDIPESSIKKSPEKAHLLKIGMWDFDSLRWNLLSNYVVDMDNFTVSANMRYPSIKKVLRYALLTNSTDFASTFSILPNPFSPDQKASNFPSLAQRLGHNTPPGTCISFVPDAPDATIQQIRIAIYSIAGEQVTKVVLQGASKLCEYRLWWDGRATGRNLVNWAALEKSTNDPDPEHARIMSGGGMCRNGRYFVVLTIRDSNNKEKNYMKQVVLIK